MQRRIDLIETAAFTDAKVDGRPAGDGAVTAAAAAAAAGEGHKGGGGL